MTIDDTGNVYITGFTQSSDFPTTPGAFDTMFGANKGFAVKLNSAGTDLIYSTFLGGEADPWGIDIDVAGNVYITGITRDSGFPTTPGAYDTSFESGSNNDFVMKLNPDGSAPIYSTFLGGSDLPQGIAVDDSGNAYIVEGNGYAVGVKKLSPDGSSLLYTKILNGIGEDYVRTVAVNSSGNAFVLGATSSPDFPTTPGAFDTEWKNCGDLYVCKLYTDGSSLVYSTFLAGSNSDGYGGDLILDDYGNAYIAANTIADDFPTTPGAYDTTANGNSDIFVAILSADGSRLLYSTYIGGSTDEYGHGIARDSSGNVYVAGTSTSYDYPVSPGAFNSTYSGIKNIVVTKLGIPETGVPTLNRVPVFLLSLCFPVILMLHKKDY
jgi:hypothetical protein